MPGTRQVEQAQNGKALGFETKLWAAADALRGSMDAAKQHVLLGPIFLKYVSDAFEEQHVRLKGETAHGADPGDPDEYRAKGIFWVPPEARWSHLRAQAKQTTIGELVSATRASDSNARRPCRTKADAWP